MLHFLFCDLCVALLGFCYLLKEIVKNKICYLELTVRRPVVVLRGCGEAGLLSQIDSLVSLVCRHWLQNKICKNIF